MNTHARLVILGWGNPSRGDDALGPELMRRASALLEQRPDIHLVEDFQLQVEHALDLEGRDLALFIDASVSCAPPFSFSRLGASQDESFTTHAISPESVLHVYGQVHASPPPPCFLLSVRGESFELGEPLSAAGSVHLEAAWDFLAGLLEEVSLQAWEERLTARVR